MKSKRCIRDEVTLPGGAVGSAHLGQSKGVGLSKTLLRTIPALFSTAAILLVAVAVFSQPGAAQTVKTPWILLVCQPSDGGPDLGDSVTKMNTMWAWPDSGFPERSYISMYSYWNDVSFGHVNMNGTKVADTIHKLSFTKAQLATKGRWDMITDCVTTFKDDFSFSPYYGIAVLVNAFGVDTGAAGIGPQTLPIGGKTPDTKAYGLVAFSRDSWMNNNLTAHELGHAFGLQHTFDDVNPPFYYHDPKTGKDIATTCPGEYWDGYDIMGGEPHFYVPGEAPMSAFWNLPGDTPIPSGPGLNAFDLMTLGWLTDADVFTYCNHPYCAVGPSTRTTIKITSLEDYNKKIGGHYAIKILADAADPNHYFTVELRQNVGWDKGLQRLENQSSSASGGGAAVLIHEIKNTACTGGYRAYLRKTGLGGHAVHDWENGFLYPGGMFLGASYSSPVQITVDRIAGGTADITIGPETPRAPQAPLTLPSGFTATPLCAGEVVLSAVGNVPNPSDYSGLTPYVVFQRMDVDGAWMDLTYSETSPGLGDFPTTDLVMYRACNRNSDGDRCTAPLSASVNHSACIPGDGGPKCGLPPLPRCKTTH